MVSVRRFKFVRDPRSSELGNNVVEFLRWMDGPTCILLQGKDSSRTRAMVTQQYSEGLTAFRALTEQYPDDKEAWYGLGEVLYHFPGGGKLTATGSDDLLAADTVLVATGVSNDFGLFFGADSRDTLGNGSPLTDGLRCCGGNVIRFPLPAQSSRQVAWPGARRRSSR